MISKQLYSLVLKMYDEGRTTREIMDATEIKSAATLYRILDKLGIKGRKGQGEFRVVVTLPEELRPFVEEIGDFSEWVTKCVYKNFEGLNPTPVIENSGDNFVYKNFEGGSGIIENRDVTPNSGIEGSPANSDLADLTVIYYNKCVTVHTTKFCSYIDEGMVRNLTLQYGSNNDLTYDEVAVYNGNALLWLWRPIFKDGKLQGLDL